MTKARRGTPCVSHQGVVPWGRDVGDQLLAAEQLKHFLPRRACRSLDAVQFTSDLYQQP